MLRHIRLSCACARAQRPYGELACFQRLQNTQPLGLAQQSEALRYHLQRGVTQRKSLFCCHRYNITV